MSDEHRHQEHDPGRKRVRPSARQIVYGAALLVAVIFAISNSQKVEVDYVLGTAMSPLWMVILISVGLGMLIDRGLIARERRRSRHGEK